MTDDTPGGYDTVDGIKKRARALENELIVTFVENAEERVFEADDGGYRIAAPDTSPNDLEMLFHFGLLTGAALEREYPAPSEVESDE